MRRNTFSSPITWIVDCFPNIIGLKPISSHRKFNAPPVPNLPLLAATEPPVCLRVPLFLCRSHGTWWDKILFKPRNISDRPRLGGAWLQLLPAGMSSLAAAFAGRWFLPHGGWTSCSPKTHLKDVSLGEKPGYISRKAHHCFWDSKSLQLRDSKHPGLFSATRSLKLGVKRMSRKCWPNTTEP